MKTTFKRSQNKKKQRKTKQIGKRDDSDIQNAEVGCIISVRVGHVKKIVRCTVRCTGLFAIKILDRNIGDSGEREKKKELFKPLKKR